MQPKTVTILEVEYKALRHADLKLTALENTGVDNWEGYGDAMKLLKEMKAEEEIDESSA